MDGNAERKGWGLRVSKWGAVTEVEPTPRVFASRVRKRLKNKGLVKTLCRRVRKNIKIKGLAEKRGVGSGWAVRLT
jgi:hypothetical protein